MRSLDELKRLITQGQARKADAHAHCMKCREESVRLAEEAVTSKKANVLLQEVATHVQHDLERAVETGVQSCLDMLFPGYSFSVSFVPRRGKTEADFKICKNGEAFDPKYSNGGGVLDTISFALRAGCLHLAGKRPVFLLDEPFGHLRDGEVFKPRKELGRVVATLVEKLGIQVIMVGDVAGTDIHPDKEYSF